MHNIITSNENFNKKIPLNDFLVTYFEKNAHVKRFLELMKKNFYDTSLCISGRFSVKFPQNIV